MSGARSGPVRPRPFLRRALPWLIGLVALGAWIAFDLKGPAHGDLRAFDPEPVARLDTQMWRAYYERKPIPLALDLAALLRQQFHLPTLRSYRVSYTASRAAFTFKRGSGRADYLRALPDLREYYGAIRQVSTTPFDVPRAAELELAWWILHRERGPRDPEGLARSLAEAAGVLYEVPAESLMTYGRLRGEAMTLRDQRATGGGMRESDWIRVRSLLDQAWRSLWQTVQNHPPKALASVPRD